MIGDGARQLALALGITCMTAVHAAPSLVAQTEIYYLLTQIGESQCEFNRNGTWYDAQRARTHLAYKYHNLSADNLITSADDFIDRAATASSFSGLAYSIRCPGHDDVASNPWLRALRAQYRDCPP